LVAFDAEFRGFACMQFLQHRLRQHAGTFNFQFALRRS